MTNVMICLLGKMTEFNSRDFLIIDRLNFFDLQKIFINTKTKFIIKKKIIDIIFNLKLLRKSKDKMSNKVVLKKTVT